MALNPKQTQFIREYLIDFNALGAAIRAGYSQKTAGQIGSRLLKNVDICAALQKEMDKRSAKTGITAEYVLTSLKNVAERCQQIVQVLDKEGNPTGEYRFEAAGANKALELLGKNLKLFTEKIDLRIIKHPDDLTEEEAIALAKVLKEKFSATG